MRATWILLILAVAAGLSRGGEAVRVADEDVARRLPDAYRDAIPLVVRSSEALVDARSGISVWASPRRAPARIAAVASPPSHTVSRGSAKCG